MVETSSLKFNVDGLIPAIVQDHRSNEVLMMAWMNAEAIERTLKSGDVTYWSRSRQCFWVKGATSGHRQKLIEFFIDCDRDTLLIKVDQTGQACHTNRRSCFYTKYENGAEIETLKPVEAG